jgi:predicted nucleotidyltransferase
MGTLPVAVAEIVDRFLDVVERHRHVVAAYVYGSQAKGTAGNWSDVDVAVVSPDFRSDLFEEQIVLMRLAAEVDDRIEPRPFRPGDFRIEDPLVAEITRTGVRVL